LSDRSKSIRKFLQTILSKKDAKDFKVALCDKSIRNKIVASLIKGSDS